MKYELSEMKLLKESESDQLVGRGKKPFVCEYNLTEEEKVAFVDAYYNRGKREAVADGSGDGFATYMLDLIKKFNAEKDSLPKDSWGYVKTISLKAWVKRNDTKKYVDTEYRSGAEYFLLGTTYIGLDYDNLSVSWSSLYDHSNLKGTCVDQWFHDVLVELCEAERQYRLDSNPIIQKIREVKNLTDEYGYLGVDRIGTIVMNANRFVEKGFSEYHNIPAPTDKELDSIIEAYGKVAKFMAELKSELAGKLQ